MNLNESISSLFINLQSLYRKNVKIENLTFPQTLIMYVLPEKGEQLSKLSFKIGVDISTMSRAIKGLEKKGLLRREYLKTDKRVISVIPQPKGKKIISEINNKFDQINNLIENYVNENELYKIEQDLHELNWIILGMLVKTV
tara:strand:- start:90 stop:515 length:426 start_codon:yes stop_codon:yes gene_type:complete